MHTNRTIGTADQLAIVAPGGSRLACRRDG